MILYSRTILGKEKSKKVWKRRVEEKRKKKCTVIFQAPIDVHRGAIDQFRRVVVCENGASHLPDAGDGKKTAQGKVEARDGCSQRRVDPVPNGEKSHRGVEYEDGSAPKADAPPPVQRIMQVHWN